MTTQITRRAAFAAPLALVPIPALASSPAGDDGVSYDAVRARLAIVCDEFSRSFAAFPDPMPAEDREALLSMSDEDIENPVRLLGLAKKYGVDLNWLFGGSVGGFLVTSRIHRNGLPANSSMLEGDPAVAAFWPFRAAVMNHEIVCRSGGPDEDNNAACHAIREPFYDLAEAQATTPEGVRLQLIGAVYGICTAKIGLPVDPLEWREEHFFESDAPHEDAAKCALWNALDALKGMQTHA